MKFVIRYSGYLAWTVSLFSLTGSLFFSEVMKLPPCVLCWYQRILMYPLVAVIGVGLLRKDRGLVFYVLPLSLLGTLVALYHNLLYYHILPENIAPCTAGVSCTTRLIEIFGFVTIPLLSLTAFIMISILTFLHHKNA